MNPATYVSRLINRIWRGADTAADNTASLADARAARAAAVSKDLFRLTQKTSERVASYPFTSSVTGSGSVLGAAMDANLPLQPKPAVRQEQFAEVKQTENRLEVQRRVVRSANRSVTRDYGHGPVDETFIRRMADESNPVATDADYETLGLRVGNPGGRPAFEPKSREQYAMTPEQARAHSVLGYAPPEQRAREAAIPPRAFIVTASDYGAPVSVDAVDKLPVSPSEYTRAASLGIREFLRSDKQTAHSAGGTLSARVVLTYDV